MKNRASRKAVILLSGGLDSAANLALCADAGEAVLAITVDYGQRAGAREMKAALALSKHYGVPHQAVSLPWLGALGRSALTNRDLAMPQIGKASLDDSEKTRPSARAVWVPNRNAVLIAVASAYAESQGADSVAVGFNREEAATFPDNTSDYLRAATAANRFSTANSVEAFSYTDLLDKKEIVRKLQALRDPFPFALLWSCYEGGEAPCGSCESCLRLNRALARSGSTS